MEKDGNNNKDEQKAYWRRSRGDGEQNDAVRCHGLQLLQCSAGVAETPSHRVSTRTFRVRRRLVTPEAVPFCCHQGLQNWADSCPFCANKNVFFPFLEYIKTLLRIEIKTFLVKLFVCECVSFGFGRRRKFLSSPECQLTVCNHLRSIRGENYEFLIFTAFFKQCCYRYLSFFFYLSYTYLSIYIFFNIFFFFPSQKGEWEKLTHTGTIGA